MDNEQQSMNTELYELSLPSEEWRPIEGYEGYYSISNMGRVFSHRSKIVLTPGKLTYGHLSVNLCKDGKSKMALVHRLVLEAFKPTSDSSLHVNHINNDPSDNRLVNLEWVSNAENHRHACRVIGKKVKHTRDKPIVQFSLSGEFIAAHKNMGEASKAIGESIGAIAESLRKKSGKSRYSQFQWKYMIDVPSEILTDIVKDLGHWYKTAEEAA